ncbi:cytochrome-c peroxidase [Flavivirga sp. 57AJ16]|uniref:cytochrome-c peroxidase n=1 Tax=Flavivirga sp. 57AJ16 TaxID=3025307 RepID=UPI002366CD70|nr:cytochrome c peroxidase [Flavivirga sp. 57AJ16]MDD7887563.1 cytochrome c peroxidase [Flavivirga sp. 57AJ16]
MYLKKPFTFIITLGLIGIIICSFKPYDTQYITVTDYKKSINDNLNQLHVEIDKLYSVSLAFKNSSSSISELKTQITSTRNAYKKVEFIVAYFYPEHIKAYINGAPLKHVDPNPVIDTSNNNGYYVVSPNEYAENLPLDERDKSHFITKTKVIDPVGLQILDELIFSDEANEQKDQILTLSKTLQADFKPIKIAFEKRNYITDFEIMEAARLELIRIFSLGITGFDTPGSLNAIAEASTALKALEEVLNPLIGQSYNAGAIHALFKDVEIYLNKNTNFERFDRLTFLTDFINPLYKTLLQVQKELEIPSSAKKYGETPSWNAYSDNIFASDFLNPYYYSLLKKKDDSKALQTLGEMLFYDTSFSQNGSMSCATCHNPKLAFTDGLAKSSASIKGKHVSRNSPSLINAVFSDRFFYDLRAYDLEEQAEHVIANHLEFNTSFSEILKKINTNETYTKDFNLTFKNESKTITRYQFSSALASYIISLRSFNSKFDQYVLGKTKTISKSVKRGFNLFTGKANCATCHFAPTFSGLVPPLYQENESEVLGILQHPETLMVDTDAGRIKNGIPLDNFNIYANSFKTTSVRNVALTAPYFHNGAYNTLTEVVKFYNEGGAAGNGLDYEVPNQTLPPDKLGLSKREIADIIAFMEALTDNPFYNE